MTIIQRSPKRSVHFEVNEISEIGASQFIQA